MNIIATFLGSIFEIYICHMFFSKYADRKISKKAYFICLFTLSSLLIIASLTLVESGLILFASSTCFFLHCSLFNLKLMKKLLLTLALVITASLSEMIIAMTTTLGMDTTPDTIQNNSILYAICILISKFLTFAILKPIKSTTLDSKPKFPFWFKSGTALLPFTSVFIIILLYRYTFIVDSPVYQICTLIAAVLLIVANLLILFVIDKQESHLRTTERLMFAEAHIKNQLSHYSELYEQQEMLKKFKHDSKNLFTSLISILETLTVEDAILYIKDKMQIETSEKNTINSGHPVIDAIIYSKNVYAQKQGISIKTIIKITTPILIDELELGVLIGNALDNAIEATEKIKDNTNKTIILNIFSTGDMLSIEVKNPTKEIVDIQHLKTSKKDKLMHGYGLAGIETITNKYNGQLSISFENNTFTLSSILVNIKK